YLQVEAVPTPLAREVPQTEAVGVIARVVVKVDAGPYPGDGMVDEHVQRGEILGLATDERRIGLVGGVRARGERRHTLERAQAGDVVGHGEGDDGGQHGESREHVSKFELA